MSAEDTAKPVIMIVEDDDQIAFLMQFILEKEGYAVERAADAKTARLLIEKLAPPALATLDINLPDGSGVDLIVRIKDTIGWERVPIMMVTAQPKDKNVNWAIRAGARAYIVKPFKPEALRETVRSLIKRSSAKS